MEQSTLREKAIPQHQQPDPSRIMQIGMGFWASKVVLSAVKLRLFTVLAGKPLRGSQLKEALKLQTTQRHVYDWLDTLVSLGFLNREGNGDEGVYTNTPDTNLFLDINKPSYMGGILEMSNNRLFRHWANLEEALLTGSPQNETKTGNMNFFEELYKDPAALSEFMEAMSGIQMGNFMALAAKFNFSGYDSLADIGGADATLSIALCRHYPTLLCKTYDLPPVGPLAQKKISQFNLDNRITVLSGSFMNEELPKAAVITMGNILHGLSEENKQMLINKAYDALPANGVLIAIENVIDNDRRQNTFGLLMSLNMLIENGDAFDYTMNDFEHWTKKAGFKRTELLPLAGPTSAAIAYK